MVLGLILMFWSTIVLFPRIHGQFCSSDDCRQLEFMPDYNYDGKRLENHVIHTADVFTEGSCRTLCYMEPNCVSYNFKTTASDNGRHRCELNNSTHEGSKHDKLVNEKDFFYRGAKDACLKNSCKNNATCQTGFTDKGYRCVCAGGFKGMHCGEGKSFVSCKEIYNNHKPQENKAYLLQMPSGKVPVYCHMSRHGLGACGGGGWTLVMKTNGNKSTFRFDSKFWSNRNDFNLTGGKTLFDNHETKLPTYWYTSFSKICLGMKIGDQTRFIVLSKRANSLYSLIADGNYRATSLGRDTWKSLIGSSASLQPNCNKEGFNCKSEAIDFSRARIGFLGNDEDNCESSNSRIGFGTGGKRVYYNTCGNQATRGGDNGDKHIKAMGYILVQ